MRFHLLLPQNLFHLREREDRESNGAAKKKKKKSHQICNSSIFMGLRLRDTYSILEAEQHPLKAARRYCSTEQFGPKFQQAAGHLPPVRGADVFPQAANKLIDVVCTQR